MSIDDHLKMIIEEKHQNYLLNTGSKLPPLQNTKNIKNTKQFSDPQAGKKKLKRNSRNQQRISLAVGYLCNSW